MLAVKKREMRKQSREKHIKPFLSFNLLQPRFLPLEIDLFYVFPPFLLLLQLQH